MHVLASSKYSLRRPHLAVGILFGRVNRDVQMEGVFLCQVVSSLQRADDAGANCLLAAREVAAYVTDPAARVTVGRRYGDHPQAPVKGLLPQ
jgi:hypothetical protein